jgi:hypothetical protein
MKTIFDAKQLTTSSPCQSAGQAAAALALSTLRAASRLLASGSLLALGACGGVGPDEADRALEPNDVILSDEEGNEPAGSRAVGSQQQPLGNACRADIRVSNLLSYPITVKKVQYWNASTGSRETELLNNKVVSSGAMEFWMENLANTQNDLITSWEVFYECHGSHDHQFHVNTPDETCIAGRVFLLEVQ